MSFKSGSGADLDNLAFEQFQRLLNQRVVFEIVFVERNGSELFLPRRSGRDWLGCGIGFSTSRWSGRRRALWLRNAWGRNGFGTCFCKRGWRFRFDEFDLSVGMAEFSEFGLKQCVVTRIIDQADVVFELGVETDGEHVF